ncbi:type II toxin-antitoxin system HicB family antitoxin [Porphyrobacter sp. SLTP]|uniref:type II toxin-antitoxin system HicB family antitoxin n=1 Tax=Porphyrobacter sp. SLTP TaxID=2683266 RepID=UPI0025700159|nr:type II toxin-antitoxin system HicB family antitoxin [Porphyrobacter sp. SLTP]
MSEPGFASLGPSLLARKGGAKPAMRPQVAPLVADETAIAALAEDQLEDLGWNDMGDSDSQGAGADIVPINADVSADDFVSGAFSGGGPIVRRQQRRLEERVLADAVMTGPEDADPEYDEDDEPVYGEAFEDEGEYADEDEGADYAPLAPAPQSEPVIVAPAPRPRAVRAARVPAAQAGRRAAFTLRLDADRHLKLRLAATMQGVSAQALVTEALDRLLAEYDELDVIANHMKRH